MPWSSKRSNCKYQKVSSFILIIDRIPPIRFDSNAPINRIFFWETFQFWFNYFCHFCIFQDFEYDSILGKFSFYLFILNVIILKFDFIQIKFEKQFELNFYTIWIKILYKSTINNIYLKLT